MHRHALFKPGLEELRGSAFPAFTALLSVFDLSSITTAHKRREVPGLPSLPFDRHPERETRTHQPNAFSLCRSDASRGPKRVFTNAFHSTQTRFGTANAFRRDCIPNSRKGETRAPTRAPPQRSQRHVHSKRRREHLEEKHRRQSRPWDTEANGRALRTLPNDRRIRRLSANTLSPRVTESAAEGGTLHEGFLRINAQPEDPDAQPDFRVFMY